MKQALIHRRKLGRFLNALIPVDKLCRIGGEFVFVRQWNSACAGSSIPIILIHDSLGCVELWREFPRTLAERLGRAVVAYDRLGYGRSSARSDLPALDFIQFEAEQILPAILLQLGIQNHVLFGHSVGGSIALCAAANAGLRCQGVVSESAQPFIEELTLDGIREAKKRFQDPDYFDRLRKWHGEKAQWVLDAWTETWLSPRFAKWSLFPYLRRVECPVLVIHGEQDEFGSVRFPGTIHEQVSGPAECHILKDCGHVPHREMPEVVIGLLSQFAPLRS